MEEEADASGSSLGYNMRDLILRLNTMWCEKLWPNMLPVNIGLTIGLHCRYALPCWEPCIVLGFQTWEHPPAEKYALSKSRIPLFVTLFMQHTKLMRWSFKMKLHACRSALCTSREGDP